MFAQSLRGQRRGLSRPRQTPYRPRLKALEARSSLVSKNRGLATILNDD